MADKKRKLTHLLGKFASSLAIMGIVLTLIIGSVSFVMTKKLLEDEKFRTLKNAAQTCASMLNGDEVEHFLDDGGNLTQSYANAAQTLNTFKKENELVYLVLHFPTRDDSTAMYEAEIEGDNHEDILTYRTVSNFLEITGGDKASMEAYDIMYDDFLKGRQNDEPMITDDEYGYLYAAYGVVRNSSGNPVALIDATVSMDDVRSSINRLLRLILLLSFAVIFAIIAVYLYVVKRIVVNPIVKLSQAAGDFVSGDELDATHIQIKSHDEIGMLANSFNKMTESIVLYIKNLETVTAEKERIGAELNVATQIQVSMLPCVFPPFPNRDEIDIFASMRPAKEVGGDFYDFFFIDENKLAVVIADVSGKGVPAALFMVIAKTLIKNHAQSGESPKEIFENTNKQLCESNKTGLFVTAWMGILDIITGRLVFANAGHNPPMLKKANSEFEFLKTRPNFVLAGYDISKYREYETYLDYNDTLFLYTDGVTEATDGANELFGDDRLKQALDIRTSKTAQEITVEMQNEIDSFVGEAPQFDDITMLTITMKKKCHDIQTLNVPAKNANVDTVTDFISGILEKSGCPLAAITQVSIAIDEIFSNIANYAYNGADGEAIIGCYVDKSENTAYISFTDSGIKFNPLNAKEPDISLGINDRIPGGLGIFMVKKIMDDVKYEYKDGKNILTIKKCFKA